MGGKVWVGGKDVNLEIDPQSAISQVKPENLVLKLSQFFGDQSTAYEGIVQ